MTGVRTTVSPQAGSTPRPSKGLRIGLWIVQGLLALTFVGTGLWKLATPIPDLAAKMPWMGQVSPGFLYATAALRHPRRARRPLAVRHAHQAGADRARCARVRRVDGVRDRLPLLARRGCEDSLQLPARRPLALRRLGPARSRAGSIRVALRRGQQKGRSRSQGRNRTVVRRAADHRWCSATIVGRSVHLSTVCGFRRARAPSKSAGPRIARCQRP